MNAAFQEVIAADDDARRDLFLTTAGRLGTAVQNVEKDFWVCWTLDALFNGLPAGTPRLLFKGGTSLSKSFALIDRFSEDIDITVFRNDLGEAASVEELEALSGKKRRARLDAIKAACQTFIAGPLLTDIAALAADAMSAAQIGRDRYRVELDAADGDQQTLLFWYPSATTANGGYIQSAVKIEGGAKSALDPHTATTVRPYAGDDFPGGDLRRVQIPIDVADWIAEALRESQDDKERFHRTAVMQLQQQYLAVQAKLDKGYDDRLAGRITDELWVRKSAEWETELSAIRRETARHERASHDYAATGSKILELAKNAHNLFIRQDSREQARLLKTLVSNSTFDRGSLSVAYVKPFDLLVEGNETGNWLGGRDSNPDNGVQSAVSYR